ncbi:parallel beta-helix domain-containing protein [Novosphingobium sp. KCTC 2891]|uniref:parallel beta-helix domain-containing protein n=1 Tax=Novosphingobium sp. KCTC 2891 TaxID=2989730 RepID=UPI0022224ADA|nr:parallel beta-helix domain-containing protein [Novosphingobium sp. KCTC 2891]
MPEKNIAAAGALVLAAFSTFASARTIAVAAGDGAQARLQEALIAAQPGDTVQLGAGRYMLDDGLSLDVDNVTVRGAGMEATVLDFSRQKGAGEGLLVTSDDVTLRDFAVEDAHGDGIKSKGADRIVYRRVRVTWTGGAKETNGAYGIYPVESTGVLIDGAMVRGASDAGIYVGQSRDITVRHSLAMGNVAGIEIENSRNALVTANTVTGNTGGILVFDLPGLPVMGGGNTVIEKNLVIANDTPNFAPKGNIVAGVPRGTGVMIMANDGVLIEGNTLEDNPTAQVMVVAYPKPFEDKRYNPFPRNVTVGANAVSGGGNDPQLPGAAELKGAFGGALPPVLWDGLGKPGEALSVTGSLPGLSLNLPAQGASPELARPALLKADAPVRKVDRKTVGAPAALEARIAR